MVARYLDPRTFNCKGGIRTLSKLEKMYDIRATNNPSNWRGPVWGISNFILFSGLIKYGFEDDARALAYKTIALFGRDLELNGSLHEYYNPDTGEAIVTHGFQNWNFLVLNMIAWLQDRKFVDLV
jgi:putative isomerase